MEICAHVELYGAYEGFTKSVAQVGFCSRGCCNKDF